MLEADGSLSVRGAPTRSRSASSRRAVPVVLHELAPQSASLEEAFMELTEDSIEFHGAHQRRGRPGRDGERTRENLNLTGTPLLVVGVDRPPRPEGSPRRKIPDPHRHHRGDRLGPRGRLRTAARIGLSMTRRSLHEPQSSHLRRRHSASKARR